MPFFFIVLTCLDAQIDEVLFSEKCETLDGECSFRLVCGTNNEKQCLGLEMDFSHDWLF